MVERLARLVTGHPATTVALALALTVLSILCIVDVTAVADRRYTEALRLQIDPSMSSVLPRESEGRVYHERMRALFGNDETLLLAVRHPDRIFRQDVLEAVQRTTERIEDIDGIRSVVSLANAPNIRSKDGDLNIAPLFDEVPSSPDELAGLRRDLERNPVLAGNLLSEDGTTTALVGYLLDMTEFEFMSAGIDDEILEIARSEFGEGVDIWLSGGAHVKAETQRTLLNDLLTVMPLSVLTLMVIAFVSFRTLRGVLIPLLTLGIAIVWTLGIAATFIPDLNIVTSSVPAILLGVGFAYAIHVVSSYYEVVAEGEADTRRGSAAREAIRRVGLATLLTGLTTGVGFASLAVSPITAVQEFGLLSAIGVGCLMVSTLTFAPALLQLLPEKSPRGGHAQEGGDWIEGLLERLGKFDVRRRRLVLGVGAALGIFSIAMIPRIELNTSVLDNFPEDQPIRQSINAINTHLGAADQLYVVLEAERKNTFKEPETLHAVESLQTWLNAQPEVGGSTSLVDYIKLINRSFNDDDPEKFAIPESKKMISQLIFFGGNDDLKKLVNSQYSLVSIPVRVNVFNSGEVVGFANRIEERLAGLPGDIKGRVTGLSVLMARSNDEIAYGQALSLLTAFVIIYAILAALFTSFWIGFMAMIPNILPIAIYFGALGLVGVTLNVVTGLVACLVLGIAVDDTIHFLTRFNTHAKERADTKEGTRAALLEVGRPVTYTSIALCLGFLVLTASTLQQQVQFGALAAFTLSVAWLVDITFTPALASGLRIVTLWDLLRLDLGEAPHREIPLFEDLTLRQTRIFALMSDIRRMQAGERLVTEGDAGDDMYVIVDGQLRAWVEREGSEVELSIMKRGSVVGEVAYFAAKRTANVDANTEALLIRFDSEDLERLRRRYPKIAAAVFRNLNRVQAERLLRTTQKVQR